MFNCASVLIGLHLASFHYGPDAQSMNNTNPGLYAVCDKTVIGTYYNSLNRQTVYAGYVFDRAFGPFGVSAGVATGYNYSLGNSGITPYAALSYKFKNGVRITAIPPIEHITVGVFHLSMEF